MSNKILETLKEHNYDIDSIKKELKINSEELNNILIDNIKENIDKNYSIEIKNLSIELRNKNEKHKILNNVSFQLNLNSFHVFIGENGAGKSTTIKTIIGQIEKYSGSITFQKGLKLEKDKIFYVPDQQPKFPNITVFNYLLYLTRLLTKKQDSDIKDEIENYLIKYSLENRRNNNINKLSTGQKQKLLIISSFLVNPPFIILDEPFANLDPTSRYMFLNELKEKSIFGTCIFLSTHIIEEIREYATHATFIKKGEIINTTSVDNGKYITDYYLNEYMKAGTYEINEK